ncbi:hypothetical protein [Methylobacterium planeticum]|uniref:Uncharacterized protein n=1 Tax=Methylobacterium planeticum TaxID=2615211 RepID=A0A6N6MT50_9HYPH|nr:hypothetical protein [Methylobacterium planeticum]KAB1072820.1 hypothetical protein F6X51_14560 [Methylobacterium planeticum]
MVDQRDKLRASRPAAMEAKDAFTSLYASGRADRAVGLGLNQSGDGWAVKVFVPSPSAARELPDHFRDFDVEVQVTGHAKAY